MLNRSPAILTFRRQQLEAWIETAIALFDAMDGDADLEDDEIEDIDEREPQSIHSRGVSGL